MRDVDSNRNRLIPPFPAKMNFFYFSVCLVPDLVLVPLLCFINEFTVAQFFLIFTTPVFFIGLFFCSFFIPFGFYLYCTAGLYRFDGTSGAVHSVNVMAKRFEMIHMLYGIVNVLSLQDVKSTGSHMICRFCFLRVLGICFFLHCFHILFLCRCLKPIFTGCLSAGIISHYRW